MKPAALAAILTALGFGAVCCAGRPDKDRVTVVIEPDYAIYRESVDRYLARRCGTLDCHGQPGRGYRIYGREGFRLYNFDAGLVSGQQETKEEEIRANFQALIALEPEELNRVMASQAGDEELRRWVFLRKALRLERHKGGEAMKLDDAGYKCVEAWLRIPVVRGDGSPIPPNERPPLPDRAKIACIEAEGFP